MSNLKFELIHICMCTYIQNHACLSTYICTNTRAYTHACLATCIHVSVYEYSLGWQCFHLGWNGNICANWLVLVGHGCYTIKTKACCCVGKEIQVFTCS